MVSIQVLATPISGCRKSWSVKPMALNIARAGARSRPSVIKRLRCLGSIEFSKGRTIQSKGNTGERLSTRHDGCPSLVTSATGRRADLGTLCSTPAPYGYTLHHYRPKPEASAHPPQCPLPSLLPAPASNSLPARPPSHASRDRAAPTASPSRPATAGLRTRLPQAWPARTTWKGRAATPPSKCASTCLACCGSEPGINASWRYSSLQFYETSVIPLRKPFPTAPLPRAPSDTHSLLSGTQTPATPAQAIARI